ncbi:MAG: glycosyltransferase [Desulfobacteraceae bacterium]|nr:glycosyltransferase [Desulfobacteraceae bacterium]
MTSLSVIIPLGPLELSYKSLLSDLVLLPDKTEVIFVGTKGSEPPDISQESLQKLLPGLSIVYLTSPVGRGKTLNKGAQVARNDFLWFLHADSRIKPATVSALFSTIKRYPKALLYFKLKWLNDGPKYMKVNEVGANLRSFFLRIPFGDQGFCISKDLFDKVGQFDEQIKYGEDHLFIWKIKHHKIPIRSTGESLLTSARKYKDGNWLKRVLFYQKVWISQAVQELLK